MQLVFPVAGVEIGGGIFLLGFHKGFRPAAPFARSLAALPRQNRS